MKVELFKKICANFNKEPNEDLYMLWNEELEGFDEYYLGLAIKNIIRTYKYFPTLNDIYKEISKVPNLEIPKEEKIKRMKQKGVVPKWVDKEITNQELTEEDIQTYEEFNSFIEEFRNEKK